MRSQQLGYRFVRSRPGFIERAMSEASSRLDRQLEPVRDLLWQVAQVAS